MTSEEIASFVENKSNINMVAFAITPLHLLGIKAFIHDLHEKKSKSITALLIILKHDTTGYALDISDIDKNIFQYVVKSDSGFTQKTSIINTLKYYLYLFQDLKYEEQNIIYVVGASVPNFQVGANIWRKCHRHVEFVITEEGVAYYMKSYLTNKLLKNIKIYLGAFIHYKFLTLTHKVHSYVLLSRKKNNVLSINNDVVESFLSIMDRKVNISFPKQSAILCTTAWNRNSINDENDLVLIKKIINILYTSGYNIYLKTHPRDNYFASKINELPHTILLQDFEIEQLFVQNDLPKYIISFSSTVLVNAKIFSKIYPICITDLLNRSCISSFYLQEIDSFKETFGELIFYPSSLEALTDYISQ